MARLLRAAAVGEKEGVLPIVDARVRGRDRVKGEVDVGQDALSDLVAEPI